jgi:ABC-type transport system involved in multi-copper enzyme maturation permease subunit
MELPLTLLRRLPFLRVSKRPASKAADPFRAMVRKEIADHVRSWRFIILVILIAMTCMGSLYTAVGQMAKTTRPDDPEGAFFFLKLFTLTDGTLPSFTVFISFLGPLLGISLGFDAINSEQNRGTLSRLMAQPVPRDYVINAKFTAALIVITIMLQILQYEAFVANLLRLVPSQLFSEATTTLLMPSVRSLGPLSMEQVYGSVPSPLPLGQSLLIVWPQLTGLIAATVVCFALSYASFMRREVRSR